MKFSNYEHFKNYCLKVCRVSYDIKYNSKEYIKIAEIIDSFEELHNVLTKEFPKAESVNVSSNDDILRTLSNILSFEGKYKFIDSINTAVKAVKQYKNKEISVLKLLDIFRKSFKMHIAVVKNEYTENTNYKTKHKDNEKRDNELLMLKGVYFIYDEHGILAYIGRSVSCIYSRCFQSAKEKGVSNYSKIELRLCKSDSDTNVYEAYYIGKYKPYRNTSMKYKDDLTIELPELEINYVVTKKDEESFINTSNIK